jgi:hypothetical protein
MEAEKLSDLTYLPLYFKLDKYIQITISFWDCVRISYWLSCEFDNPRTNVELRQSFSEFSETQWCQRKNRANVLRQASRMKQNLGEKYKIVET